MRIGPLMVEANEERRDLSFQMTPSQMPRLWELPSGNSTPRKQLATRYGLSIYSELLNSGAIFPRVGAGPPAAELPGKLFEPMDS